VKDLVLDDLGLDCGARPDRVEQLPVGHHLPGARDQMVEDGELRPRQQNAFLSSAAGTTPEALVRRIEAKRRNLCHKGESSVMGGSARYRILNVAPGQAAARRPCAASFSSFDQDAGTPGG
jgi:hypothetical protein